eukprot:m51a1_g4790 hypothetical protein (215) ;mRNA; r:71374-72241
MELLDVQKRFELALREASTLARQTSDVGALHESLLALEAVVRKMRSLSAPRSHHLLRVEEPFSLAGSARPRSSSLPPAAISLELEEEEEEVCASVEAASRGEPVPVPITVFDLERGAGARQERSVASMVSSARLRASNSQMPPPHISITSSSSSITGIKRPVSHGLAMNTEGLAVPVPRATSLTGMTPRGALRATGSQASLRASMSPLVKSMPP